MAAFVDAFRQSLEERDQAYAATEFRIGVATWASLLGQIATGILSIFAFLFAARRGARASKAREAVNSPMRLANRSCVCSR
jgi:uncharacterized membrane protein